MKKLIACLGLAIILISCTQVNADVLELDGTYIGYFHRSGQDTARVSIHFNGNTFIGQSSAAQYPAIGQGSFKQIANIISFKGTVNHNDADKSLLLNGDYNYQYNDDGTIRIWRQTPLCLDEYLLRRPAR